MDLGSNNKNEHHLFRNPLGYLLELDATLKVEQIRFRFLLGLLGLLALPVGLGLLGLAFPGLPGLLELQGLPRLLGLPVLM